ncbi:hypothetical protein BDY21DRAFT_92628 [Lineolata rhizophorae]|uniref:Uncharacterized protein n=1 Tax=Lineolata rhizophorae TaxID=578093 RepID=A0A6A6PCG6_9PEZI|nr:hypothetical protein BDY21DRAFT_92628 [Lineolata rhizophorae]
MAATDIFVTQFHIRYFDLEKRERPPRGAGNGDGGGGGDAIPTSRDGNAGAHYFPGIQLRREMGVLLGGSESSDETAVVERRVSLLLASSLREMPARWSVTTLMPPSKQQRREYEPFYEHDVLPVGRDGDELGNLFGVGVFIKAIDRTLKDCFASWNGVLRGLDEELMSTVTAILDPVKRHALMFDDGTFSRSELYFVVLQLLLVFADHVEQTVEDVRDARRQCMWLLQRRFPRPEEAQIRALIRIEERWRRLLDEQEERAESLAQRLHRKRQEIESLRHGVRFSSFE